MDFISYALAKKAMNMATGGIKISDIEIEDGELIISLSTGEVMNAGKIPAADMEEIENLKQEVAKLNQSVITENGGILKGPLTLADNPIEDLQAATKKYVDEKHIQYVLSKKTKDEFPGTGRETVLYKAEEEKRLYQWNPISSQYEALNESQSSGIENIKIINGGNSNARN